MFWSRNNNKKILIMNLSGGLYSGFRILRVDMVYGILKKLYRYLGTLNVLSFLQLIQAEMHTNHYKSFFLTSCQTMNSPFIFSEGL